MKFQFIRKIVSCNSLTSKTDTSDKIFNLRKLWRKLTPYIGNRVFSSNKIRILLKVAIKLRKSMIKFSM